VKSSPSRLCSEVISLLLTTCTSCICSHQQIDDHRKGRRTTYKAIKQTKGKLELKRFHHAIRYTFTVQYTQIIQACYDLQINTLRINSTHPDTYNLVGFSGCLHLWWIPLLIPELCVTSVTMNQFPHTQG